MNRIKLLSIIILFHGSILYNGSGFVRVIDGDTFVLYDSLNSKLHTVRIASINAPEKGTFYADTATQVLKSFVSKDSLVVNLIKKDLYSRDVSEVKQNGQRLDSFILVNGAAVLYYKYCLNYNLSIQQSKAMNLKIGIWRKHK